ncbi:hypothetical protein [Brevibacillus invocatus]|uniref:Uncharacterized protein n=1 Tax=Brevibacillus invocatus TaxID=173959 RepID=A0A3M8CLX9_9BACL|nr:hypothetical protein [Brevibacillus invocatus]MCM3080923.1 hypothetical protein [Brevibacillus invocatus]MCM3431224.1 hypothetical protein [Brevibacillus invocatus]RNB76541.1 hypothetical protein EDM52_02475 [Brevibacillus invocatus]
MSDFEQDGFEERRENREGRRRRRSLVRTTGILQNNQAVALNVHVELVNLNLDEVEVRVQVLNWGTAVTQTNPVSTALDVTQFLLGNTRTAFNATIPASNHYEVRLTVAGNDENVLINTYGRTAVGGGIPNGYVVLNSEFTTVEIENCIF